MKRPPHEQFEKHVLSISLGSASRDIDQQVELLGVLLRLERRGLDGNVNQAAALIRELDGKAAAIGLGGIDLYIYTRQQRYTFRQARYLARQAYQTPVVCGAGLKHSLERYIVTSLNETLDWPSQKVLLVSAVDRYGMAESLVAAGAECIFGDMMFALKVPMAIKKLSQVDRLGAVLLPLMTQLPISWLYPTGEAQTQVSKHLPSFLQRAYDWATVIAGDWHFIRRYLPERLDGKTILTNTTTSQDITLLKERGAKQLITTTPRYNGRSLATNLLEAALIAASGCYPLSQADYLALIKQANLQANITNLA